MPAFAPRPTRATLPLTLLAALPLLAACNPGGAIVQPVSRAESPEEAACRREAARRPEVVALMRQQPPIDNITWYQRWKAEVANAQLRATNDCLRAGGQPISGGVESVRQPGMGGPDDRSLR
ncbi:phosphoribosylamine--glycine ligase [Roseomonas gilardii subsp. gilardii]|uniref:phosphoribosylamine--glycine ligase n=1 Tax=Roseomonas gilardii TaxID=257708 RepID=UPI001FF83B32|nr:phosphoribosylamine--glycine ligase [Roseomonas gilardii]UPG72828.1 phosphoribosylamine--glycine ligase [Roseomonas gilardii subsp. gilardii]